MHISATGTNLLTASWMSPDYPAISALFTLFPRPPHKLNFLSSPKHKLTHFMKSILRTFTPCHTWPNHHHHYHIIAINTCKTGEGYLELVAEAAAVAVAADWQPVALACWLHLTNTVSQLPAYWLGLPTSATSKTAPLLSELLPPCFDPCWM